MQQTNQKIHSQRRGETNIYSASTWQNVKILLISKVDTYPVVSRLQNESLLIWKTELAMWSGVQPQRDDEPSCQHYPSNPIPAFVTIITSESTLISTISNLFCNDIIFTSNKVRKPVCLFILSSPAGGALTATLSSSLKTNSHSENITKTNQSWLWIQLTVLLSLNTRKLFSPLFASTMPDRSRAWGQNRSRVVKADPA